LSPEQVAAVEELVSQGWRKERVDSQEVMREMAEQRGRVARVVS
jgi:hypothetical protein